MTAQLYQFTREIPPVQASKPYTCSCLEHNLASLTWIQLCDIYYDGKFNIVALQLKTTQQLNIETPNLLVILKGQVHLRYKKRTKTYCIIQSLWVSANNFGYMCRVKEQPLRFLPSPQRRWMKLSVALKALEIIISERSNRQLNMYLLPTKWCATDYWATRCKNSMLFLLRVTVDVYLNRCVSLGIRLTEWSKLIKNSEHTHIKPTTVQLGFTWPDETEHHPLSNTWVRSWILGISTLVKSQVEWLGSCSTTSRFTSVLHLNAHS